MKFIYDDQEIELNKTSTDKELTLASLKAQEFQFKVGYRNYKDTEKRLAENKAEKRNIDNELLEKYYNNNEVIF